MCEYIQQPPQVCSVKGRNTTLNEGACDKAKRNAGSLVVLCRRFIQHTDFHMFLDQHIATCWCGHPSQPFTQLAPAVDMSRLRTASSNSQQYSKSNILQSMYLYAASGRRTY
jgi:hypothetical protein